MEKGQRITEARLFAGLTKSALARELGVTHTAVGLWESGDTKNLKNDHLYKLAEITGYSAQWLATGEGDKFSSAGSLSKEEQQLIAGFRSAGDDVRAMLLRAIEK